MPGSGVASHHIISIGIDYDPPHEVKPYSHPGLLSERFGRSVPALSIPGNRLTIAGVNSWGSLPDLACS